MTDICLGFEVHQPLRLRGNFFWDRMELQPVPSGSLLSYYFGTDTDGEVFQRAARKCYLPANRILLEQIDRFKRDSRPFKVAFSLSGVYLEQCERWNIDVLDSFRQLARTGQVEFLEQTYYHSLASLWPDRSEWREQVRLHREKVRALLGIEPTFFENTEFLYNNAIARAAEEMGYCGIFTEGVERMLAGRSPNYVYKPVGCDRLRVLVRNYRLSDDIGFRFSSRWWAEWPLTADKYAGWLAATPGQCINLFIDYETFGEHHWPETGIHEFLRHLAEHVLQLPQLKFATPSEIVAEHPPAGELDVGDFGIISWADLERDTSCWLGNTLQWAYYEAIQRLEPLVKEAGEPELLQIWRYLQMTDHLYYMFMGSGGPGLVHSYFSPYGTPYDAFVTAFTAVLDFAARLRSTVIPALSSFTFALQGQPLATAHSLCGFREQLTQVPLAAIEEHLRNGDFERWFEHALLDPVLAADVRKLRSARSSGPRVQQGLIQYVSKRLATLTAHPPFRSSLPRREFPAERAVVERAERSLRHLPAWRSFWFYRAPGSYTGLAAASLAEFLQQLWRVEDNVLTFHAARGDFEAWVRDAVQDAELADRLKQMPPSSDAGELRRQLIRIVQGRVGDLQAALGLPTSQAPR